VTYRLLTGDVPRTWPPAERARTATYPSAPVSGIAVSNPFVAVRIWTTGGFRSGRETKCWGGRLRTLPVGGAARRGTAACENDHRRSDQAPHGTTIVSLRGRRRGQPALYAAQIVTLLVARLVDAKVPATVLTPAVDSIR
jgi:hypothetical protein